VRDLINRVRHEMSVNVHGRQVGEQTHLGVNRIEYNGHGQPALPYQPGAPVMPPQPAVVPPAPQPSLGSPPAPAERDSTPEQIMALLKQLGELRDAGVVTPEEFEAKKKDLLDRL
jgi:hypothetical protein